MNAVRIVNDHIWSIDTNIKNPRYECNQYTLYP